MDKTYYDILGIPQDFDFESQKAELKAKYLALMRENYPDFHPTEREFYTNKTAEISNAYDVLSDPGKRDLYDLELKRERWRAQQQEGNQGGMGVHIGTVHDEDQGGGFTFGMGGLEQTFEGIFSTMFPSQVSIPVYDMLLMTAYVDAHRVNYDGQWQVKKQANDTRWWIPPVVGMVQKHNGQLGIYRVVSDWRPVGKIGKPIEYRQTEQDNYTLYEPHQLFDIRTFPDAREHFGRHDVQFPRIIGKHYDAIRSLGNKLIQLEGGYIISIGQEIDLFDKSADRVTVFMLERLGISQAYHEPHIRFPHTDLSQIYQDLRRELFFTPDTFGRGKETK